VPSNFCSKRNPLALARLCGWVLGLILFWTGPVHATVVTFDWPNPPGWTAGTPTAGQTKTQIFTSFYPNDLTVSINNSGVAAQGMVFNAGYPQISTTPLTGGLSVNGLQLYASSSQVFGAYIQTTVAFATPVTNLSFQIWDVDSFSGQFVDKISSIQALAVGGGIVGPNSVTSAVAGYNSITGTGLATVVLGTAVASDTTNQGTIDITFNGPITQFSFQWSNNDPARGAQAIALGSLIYTPIPESNSHYVAGLIGLLAIGLDLRRRRAKETASQTKETL
jgi:hypothetical protein